MRHEQVARMSAAIAALIRATPAASRQQPLQMLSVRSSLRSSLSRPRVSAWTGPLRRSRREMALPRFNRTSDIERGDSRLPTTGLPEGTTGTAMLGGGGA